MGVIRANNIRGVEWLLDNACPLDVNYKRGEALETACRFGYPKVVKLLLEDDRVNVNVQGLEMLVYAVQSDNLETVRLLLDCPTFDLMAGEDPAMPFVNATLDSVRPAAMIHLIVYHPRITKAHVSPYVLPSLCRRKLFNIVGRVLALMDFKLPPHLDSRWLARDKRVMQKAIYYYQKFNQ